MDMIHRMHDSQCVQGCVTIDVLDGKTLEPIERIVSGNRVVADGRKYLGTLLKGAILAPVYVSVGTSTVAPIDGDTALLAEVFRDSITQRIDIVDGVRIRLFLPTTAANGNMLAEAGIFGPTPELLMLARVTHAGIAKTSSVAINYSWDITFAQP